MRTVLIVEDDTSTCEMLVRMVDAWEEIDATEEIRVAILTGAGDTFCAERISRRCSAANRTTSGRNDSKRTRTWRGGLCCATTA